MSAATVRRWLVLRLEAPLLSFGAVAIDNYGVTWDFPALSMMTGLFANALGWERTERVAHQALQDRIILASRRDDEPYHGVLRDVQNARLYANDTGWTTRGSPEGRNSKSPSFANTDRDLSAADQKRLGSYLTHQRYRDYHPDALLTVVITLAPPNTATDVASSRPAPSLDDLALALDRPQRPLFIGRKPCLPSAPLNAGFIEAATAHAALTTLPLASPRRPARTATYRAQWPVGEGPSSGELVYRGLALADRRNWMSGLHGGTRHVIDGGVRPLTPAHEGRPQ